MYPGITDDEVASLLKTIIVDCSPKNTYYLF